jgi:tRNA threonylcarbamoyladenosine biosynthesis protein TsaE
MPGRYQTTSAAQTEALGAKLAAGLAAGDVVLVEGELGAGKTTFVRGACRALGVESPVTSPTFTIGQRYPAPVPIAHLDLFRIADLSDEDPEMLADYLGPDTIAFVEWADGAAGEIAAVARVAARVRIEHAGGNARAVVIELLGACLDGPARPDAADGLRNASSSGVRRRAATASPPASLPCSPLDRPGRTSPSRQTP